MGMGLCACSFGCGLLSPCAEEAGGTTHIVLTFDDGPVAADIADPVSVADETVLLEPLERILGTLSERGVRAVFFVEGPGNASDEPGLVAVYADGLRAIYESGHVLGYHAYDHDASIWIQVIGDDERTAAAMAADLDRLERFLDNALRTVGGLRQTYFSPVFRQPFGGGGVTIRQGRQVADSRGWTYRGFAIDSADWTDNADADPRSREVLPVSTEDEHVAYTLGLLRSGVQRYAGRPVIDVLLHVNTFTADHLGDWIDELTAATMDVTGAELIFDVPSCYVEFDDPTVDTSVIRELLLAW